MKKAYLFPILFGALLLIFSAPIGLLCRQLFFSGGETDLLNVLLDGCVRGVQLLGAVILALGGVGAIFKK